MYATLISKIKTTLQGVSAIKAIYEYPTTNITKYPAAMFFPDAFQNAFETNKENFKTYRFRLFIIVGATQKERVDIFSTVLPKTVDAVLSAFDTGWSGGVISGHPSSFLISSGIWSMGVTQNGLEATAELSLEVRALTDV